MKLYIAGPMSGIPQFNYPAFDTAAEFLRENGFEVVSPAEMDSDEVRAAAMRSETGNFRDIVDTGETWGDFLARDVKLIADEVDGVCLLPNWRHSRGARLEAFVALNCQKPVYLLETLTADPLDGRPADPLTLLAPIGAYTATQGDVSRYE